MWHMFRFRSAQIDRFAPLAVYWTLCVSQVTGGGAIEAPGT